VEKVKVVKQNFKNKLKAGHRWLPTIILPTWEAEMGRISVPEEPRKKVS
jgi:hypothetical protein